MNQFLTIVCQELGVFLCVHLVHVPRLVSRDNYILLCRGFTKPALHFILELVVNPPELDISEQTYQFIHGILYHSSALWWRSTV